MTEKSSAAPHGVSPAATAADTARHKLECLARWVNNLPDKPARQEFLARFAKGKPPAALAELKSEMLKQWESRHARDLG